MLLTNENHLFIYENWLLFKIIFELQRNILILIKLITFCIQLKYLRALTTYNQYLVKMRPKILWYTIGHHNIVRAIKILRLRQIKYFPLFNFLQFQSFYRNHRLPWAIVADLTTFEGKCVLLILRDATSSAHTWMV